jgi:DNA-binding transcriptional ArsR family regulator
MDADPSPDNGSGTNAASRKERILEALGDPVSRRILVMLTDAPHPAADLLTPGGIPQSTLYRKIHELEGLGLVGIQRTAITADGKRVDLYRSLLEDLHVDLKGSSVRIDVKLRDLAGERLREMWRAVREEARR